MKRKFLALLQLRRIKQTSCAGKHAYDNKADAMAACRHTRQAAINSHLMDVYFCKHCCKWYIGHSVKKHSFSSRRHRGYAEVDHGN